MDIFQHQAVEKLKSWFSKADSWQKDLFCAIWDESSKGEQLLDRIIKLIDQRHLGEACRFTPKETFPKELSFLESTVSPVILSSISDIAGVGALAPSAALKFGNGLTIVYGENGCGKSSYVRILKALENPANAASVLGNVFAEQTTPARANITFSEDGNETTITWTKDSKEKYPIQIYDTAEARRFVEKENEVVYEPKVLSVITEMARIYEQLSMVYKQRAADTQQKISPITDELQRHPIVSEFEKLSTEKGVGQFVKKYPWGETSKNELSSIIESLKESDPLKTAVALESKREIVRGHGYTILGLQKLVDDMACESYLSKRKRQIETKKAQDALIAASSEQSILGEFGSDVWLSMWTQANAYINLIEATEPGVPVSESGRCALCQQELDALAQTRMQNFKEFCDSKVAADAEQAYKDFGKTVGILQKEIENTIDLAKIKESLTASAIPLEIQTTIMSLYGEIIARCTWLLEYDEKNPADCPDIQSKEATTETFKNIVANMERQIGVLRAAGTNQEQQIARKNELAAIKWAISNLSVKEQLIKFNQIVATCKTNALTSMKKDLSRLLITDAYIQRFQSEMCLLDERKQIRVELVEASPKHGKAYHQVALRGAKSLGKHKNGEILSEGEFRVVSLAAFLADISSWGKVMPFIFDDPITSLDQKYEACVARRLINLSVERQVIVFTHRLAFAQLLNNEATQFNIVADQAGDVTRALVKNIELRKSPLGAPDAPGFLKDVSLGKATTQLLSVDIPAIKRAQKEERYSEADHLTKTLCSDFRKVIEQGIGHDLLSGIISRFNREISSLKLPRLYAMTQKDISLFHDMMTKYSYQEHSQPVEAPIELPDISEIESDVLKMQAWVKEYSKRCDSVADKAKGKKLGG